jgi:hypothetical protein
MKESKEKKDFSKEVDYISNYLSEKANILEHACKHISEKWEEHNIQNQFLVRTNAIYFNNSIRVKVLVESVAGKYNVIFYSRQDAISVELLNHKPELKMAVQDFVLSVMGDFIEKGMEAMRVEVINNTRERVDPSDQELDDFLLAYPLKMDDVYPETK